MAQGLTEDTLELIREAADFIGTPVEALAFHQPNKQEESAKGAGDTHNEGNSTSPMPDAVVSQAGAAVSSHPPVQEVSPNPESTGARKPSSTPLLPRNRRAVMILHSLERHEPLDVIARRYSVEIETLRQWQEEFLAAGLERLEGLEVLESKEITQRGEEELGSPEPKLTAAVQGDTAKTNCGCPSATKSEEKRRLTISDPRLATLVDRWMGKS